MTPQLGRLLLSSPVLWALVSCSDNGGTDVVDQCEVVELPASGAANAPVVTDVALEVQNGDGIIALATATDPQGDDNLRDVPQTLGVFPDKLCEGAPIVLLDDLVGSGIEESFGIVVPITHPLYAAIGAEESWPVAIDFKDADGNLTSIRVQARIIKDIGG